MGKMVSVMLSDSEASFLEQYCLKHGLSKSDALRYAIELLSTKEKAEEIPKTKYRKIVVKASHIKLVTLTHTSIDIEGEDLYIESAL
mgnify:FL=1